MYVEKQLTKSSQDESLSARLSFLVWYYTEWKRDTLNNLSRDAMKHLDYYS